MRLISAFLFLLATPVSAGVEDAVELTKKLHHTFAMQTQVLSEQAQNNCTAASLKPAYHDAFDTWVAANTIHFGPIEDVGGSLSVAFWPDKKGFTSKAIKRLLKEDVEQLKDPKYFAEVSIAGKGFFALDLLMFDPEFNGYSKDSTTCVLIQSITKEIATKADRINTLWHDSFADFILTAGQPENTVFLSKQEAAQAYLTSVIGTLEFIETARLKRPLGTLERSRPKRAEGWRSGRPLRNIEVSLNALDDMVSALGDDQADITQEELETALTFIPSIQDKSFQTIIEKSVKFKVESLLQMVVNIKEAAIQELGNHLGVTTGFNSLDGD